MHNLRPRHVGPGRQGVADNGNRSCVERGIDMLIAVGGVAAHGDETPARLHPAAVVVQPGNGRIALLGDVFRTIQQLEKVHSTRIIATFSGTAARHQVVPGTTTESANLWGRLPSA